MRRKHRLLPAIVVVLAACATTAPPRQESRTVPGVNFSAYSTYGWSSPAENATVDAPLRILDVNIRDAIRAEMTRRGYEEVKENPALLVDYETAAADKIRSNPVRIGIGMGSYGGNGGGSVSMGSSSVQSYQEGRLVIHVLDAGKNQEIWYGAVAGRVEQKSLDAAAVARVVATAMADFPARDGTPVAMP
ncbi:MAG: DUF4136 domain-containing protein [Gammaproteobacteria bacterium]